VTLRRQGWAIDSGGSNCRLTSGWAAADYQLDRRLRLGPRPTARHRRRHGLRGSKTAKVSRDNAPPIFLLVNTRGGRAPGPPLDRVAALDPVGDASPRPARRPGCRRTRGRTATGRADPAHFATSSGGSSPAWSSNQRADLDRPPGSAAGRRSGDGFAQVGRRNARPAAEALKLPGGRGQQGLLTAGSGGGPRRRTCFGGVISSAARTHQVLAPRVVIG